MSKKAIPPESDGHTLLIAGSKESYKVGLRQHTKNIQEAR